MALAFNAPNSRMIVYEPVRNENGEIVDFTFVLISKATVDFFGGKDFTGKTITQALPDGNTMIADMARVIETGITHSWTRFYEVGQHEGNWFEVTDTRSGNYLVRVWDNITKRKLADEVLENQLAEQAEKKYLTLFNSIDLGFCIIEMIYDEKGKAYDYRFIEYNPAFEKQTGLTDAKGKTIKTLNPKHEQHWFDMYGRIAQTGEALYFEQEAVLINGWYEVSAFSVANDGKTVAVIFNDITLRKTAEKELNAFNTKLENEVKDRTSSLKEVNEILGQKIDELAKSNKELESFNYIASHDLQEPLRKIQTFLTLIKQRGKDEATVIGYMDKINTSAERMSALISDVLTYSKLSIEKHFVPIDLNIIIDNVLSDYELVISEKNAVVKKGILPIINAVPPQMHQLFSNLISNALKYSSNAPIIEIKSEIKTVKDLQIAEIIVADNGIGFDDQYSDQIFKLFQRLHGKSEYSGTGIGLSICKKITEQHNGNISAKSEIGKGTTFTVQLPV